MNKKGHPYSHQLILNVKERNFDNDITRLIDQSSRYGIDDGPIRIGTQTIIGSITEFVLESAKMLDVIAADFETEIKRAREDIAEFESVIDDLRSEIDSLKKAQKKPASTPRKRTPAKKE